MCSSPWRKPNSRERLKAGISLLSFSLFFTYSVLSSSSPHPLTKQASSIHSPEGKLQESSHLSSLSPGMATEALRIEVSQTGHTHTETYLESLNQASLSWTSWPSIKLLFILSSVNYTPKQNRLQPEQNWKSLVLQDIQSLKMISIYMSKILPQFFASSYE